MIEPSVKVVTNAEHIQLFLILGISITIRPVLLIKLKGVVVA